MSYAAISAGGKNLEEEEEGGRRHCLLIPQLQQGVAEIMKTRQSYCARQRWGVNFYGARGIWKGVLRW
jgi:hypothetical protein